MEESALVRLARITRVEAHRRRGDSGKTQQVDAHVRKVLDAFGAGADSKTKRGAFTTETPVISALVDKSQQKAYPGSNKETTKPYAVSVRAGKANRAMVQAKIAQQGKQFRLYRPATDGPAMKAKGLLLPPATWVNVLVAKDLDNPPGGKYLTGQAPNHAKDKATGVKGHWKWQDKRLKAKTAAAAAEKWTLMARLQKGFKKVDAAIRSTKDSDPLDATIYFMRLTGMRPGEDKDKNDLYDTVGALNIRAEHVKVVGNKVTLTFIPGKSKGRPITIVHEDNKALATHLRRWQKGKKPGDRLFNRKPGEDFGSAELAERVRKISGDEHMEPRKFRTQLATATTARAIQAYLETHTAPLTKAAFKKVAKELVGEAQQLLGHTTWTMTYGNYVNPAIWGPLIADESWL